MTWRAPGLSLARLRRGPRPARRSSARRASSTSSRSGRRSLLHLRHRQEPARNRSRTAPDLAVYLAARQRPGLGVPFGAPHRAEALEEVLVRREARAAVRALHLPGALFFVFARAHVRSPAEGEDERSSGHARARRPAGASTGRSARLPWACPSPCSRIATRGAPVRLRSPRANTNGSAQGWARAGRGHARARTGLYPGRSRRARNSGPARRERRGPRA